MSRIEGIQASICEQSTEPGENEALKKTPFARGPTQKWTEDANTEVYRPPGFAATTVTESKDSNIAAEVHGGMGNTINYYHFHMDKRDIDVSDIMTQILDKQSCNTNNVATAAKVAERDSSTLSEDETDSTHCSTINKPQRSQEHSLLRNTQSELEEGKESTLSSKCLKSGPSETPIEAVSLKSSVKQCQSDLEDLQCTCTHRKKCQQNQNVLTGDVDLHSGCTSTRRNSFCFKVRDRAESVDLRAMDYGTQEEFSSIEIRLASGEKRNASKHEFDDHKRRDSKDASVFDLERVTDSGVKAVTEANILKMVKLAEMYPDKMKEMSSFLDSKLVPSYETDIRQCCNVM